MNADYERIALAIRYLEQHLEQQPGLEQLAAALHISPFHLQRLFRRWAGVSPKRFLQFLTVEYAKQLLQHSHGVLETSYATGLSGPSRLHDHFITLEAVTPGEYKSQGAGLTLRYGVHSSPFGPLFLALTERGICSLAFAAEPAAAENLAELQRNWPGATLLHDPTAGAAIAVNIFTPGTPAQAPLTLLVRGTNFQINVWKALLNIPPGRLCSYDQLARLLGRPGACRAVGGAVAANPIGYLIPCHRVIRSIGLPGGYRWGGTRKRALIAWEAARHGGGPAAARQRPITVCVPP